MLLSKSICLMTILLVTVNCGAADTPKDIQAIAQVKGMRPEPPSAIRFVVIGDRNGGNIPGLWPKAIEEINLLKPELVMSVGDFVEGYTEDAAEIDKQWTAFMAETTKIEAPFFFTPGNHDETNPVMRQLYLKLFGKDGRSYYSFDYRGCHFAVLDSNLFTRQGIDPNQLEWFKADMAAARDATHVFLFYHHPAGEKSAAWKQIAPLLTPGKATVFNGHTHAMSYAKQDGIDTYTLAATAAMMDNASPDFGDLEMFAYVTFGGEKATVAALTVGEVRSGKHVDRAFDTQAYPLSENTSVDQEPVAGGRKVTITQPNASPLSFDVTITVDGSGYVSAPRETVLAVSPNTSASARIEIQDCSSSTQDPLASMPKVKRKYVFMDPKGGKAVLNAETTLGRFSTIRKVTGITIDGKLDDWADVKPEILPPFGTLMTDGEGWSGNDDCSAGVRLACDANTLYVAITTTDNVLRTGLTPATENDGFALFWSVPTVARSAEPNMPMAGSVRLIPAAGQVPPIWALKKNLRRPPGFRAFATQGEHGYVCELALPLAEIGCKLPMQPGATLNWRLQLRDIDEAKGHARVFTIGGSADPKESAGTWITGVVK
jgi:hypothetical protein